jgi:DNA replication factor GINS
MNLDELQSVRDRERQTDKLQQLRASFYADAGEFIQQLRDQREHAAERADDPFDAPEVSRLSDEIDTAEQTVEAIYEKRVGKIVKAASFAAADLPAESDGMTDEETELFETLVGDIKANREHVLDVLAGEPSANDDTAGTAEAEPATGATDGDAGAALDQGVSATAGQSSESPDVGAADVMGGDGAAAPDPPTDGSPTPEPPAETEADRVPPAESVPEPGESSQTEAGEPPQTEAGSPSAPPEDSEPPVRNDGGTGSEGDVPRETVRITDDVGEIVGLDERDYDLSTDDVVTLPRTNADLLVERDAAEQL